MEPAGTNVGQIVETSKQLVQRLFTTGENRLELLLVELEEARQSLVQAILLALGLAACGFLALLALNVAIVVWFWNGSPTMALLVMAGLYAGIAGYLYHRLNRFLGEWRMLSATLEQLQKDLVCLKSKLS